MSGFRKKLIWIIRRFRSFGVYFDFLHHVSYRDVSHNLFFFETHGRCFIKCFGNIDFFYFSYHFHQITFKNHVLSMNRDFWAILVRFVPLDNICVECDHCAAHHRPFALVVKCSDRKPYDFPISNQHLHRPLDRIDEQNYLRVCKQPPARCYWLPRMEMRLSASYTHFCAVIPKVWREHSVYCRVKVRQVRP